MLKMNYSPRTQGNKTFNVSLLIMNNFTVLKHKMTKCFVKITKPTIAEINAAEKPNPQVLCGKSFLFNQLNQINFKIKMKKTSNHAYDITLLN